MEGYPGDEPLIPHGHLYSDSLLQSSWANYKDATATESDIILYERLIELVKATHVPHGLKGVGFSRASLIW